MRPIQAGGSLDPQNVGLGILAALRVFRHIQLSGTAFSYVRAIWSHARRVVPRWSPDLGGVLRRSARPYGGSH